MAAKRGLFGRNTLSPLEVTGMQLWLDATTITGIANGAAVATWNDLSGNGRNASQSTGSLQPLYQSSYANLNNRQAVLFDGVDDRYDITWDSTTQIWIACAMYMNGTADLDGLFGTTNSDTGFRFTTTGPNWAGSGWTMANLVVVSLPIVATGKQVVSASLTPASGNRQFGGYFNTGARNIKAAIGEMLAYAPVPSASQQNGILNYLRDHWG